MPADFRASPPHDESTTQTGGPAAPGDALHRLFRSLETALPRPATVVRREAQAGGSAPDKRAHAMPKFLTDDVPAESTWRKSGTRQSLTAPVSLGASIVAILLISAWALFDVARDIAPATKDEVARGPQVPAPAVSRLSFLSDDGCRNAPCAALLTFVPATPPTPPAGSTVYTTAAGAPEPQDGTPAIAAAALDPLDVVTVKGLPPDARLSVGNRISPTEWALTVGDLGNLGLVVPAGHTAPIRAEFEIKNQDGKEVAEFGLTIEHEAKANEPATAETKPAKTPRIKTAKAAQKAGPAPAPASTNVVQGTAKAAAPAPAATSKKNAGEKETAAAPSIFPWFSASSDNDDDGPDDEPAPVHPGPEPGFETLINLGGGFFAFEPSKP